MTQIYDVLVVDGDCYPVPREVTDWIETYPENFDEPEEIPEFIRKLYCEDEYEAIKSMYVDDGEEDKINFIRITIGSWENDRVLGIVPFFQSFEDMGYAREWISENNFKLGHKLDYLSY